MDQHLTDIKKANPLLWIACGKEDSLYQRSSDLAEKLKAAGVRHTWRVTPGAPYLHRMAPEPRGVRAAPLPLNLRPNS
jgi:acetyl esterase/lipase